MIRAFRQVKQQHAEAALVLIGDGELRDTLQQCAKAESVTDSVHFLGDRDDVRDLLQGLDLFVLSSVTEGYSMVLLEASAAALPIIATDVGGNSEIIRDGHTGRLVPPSNADLLAAAMITLLQQPRVAQSLGRSAREWVERHGSLEAMASRYALVYQGDAQGLGI